MFQSMILNKNIIIAMTNHHDSSSETPFSSNNYVHSTFNPLTLKISLVILLTVCHTVLAMLV